MSSVLDWSNVLSLGEQQRLALARVLFNLPASALDLATESQMYSLLHEGGTSYLSVGHRPSLLRYHDTKLLLLGAGEDVLMSSIDHSREDPLIFKATELHRILLCNSFVKTEQKITLALLD